MRDKRKNRRGKPQKRVTLPLLILKSLKFKKMNEEKWKTILKLSIQAERQKKEALKRMREMQKEMEERSDEAIRLSFQFQKDIAKIFNSK